MILRRQLSIASGEFEDQKPAADSRWRTKPSNTLHPLTAEGATRASGGTQQHLPKPVLSSTMHLPSRVVLGDDSLLQVPNESVDPCVPG